MATPVQCIPLLHPGRHSVGIKNDFHKFVESRFEKLFRNDYDLTNTVLNDDNTSISSYLDPNTCGRIHESSFCSFRPTGTRFGVLAMGQR